MADAVNGDAEGKGECLVRVTPAKAPTLEIKTKAETLVGPGVRSIVQGMLARCGSPSVAVVIEESGALNYVLEARTETALREALSIDPPALAAQVKRSATQPDRPRRSRLYAPGNNPRLLAGIEVYGADCVLLDLEDSVPPAEKMAARILVKHLLAHVEFPNEVWVRINALDQGGREDVREIVAGQPHGLCLPKAESAEDVAELSSLLQKEERRYGLPSGSVKIMPIIETARGVLNCVEIASAGNRVVMIAFGAEDYTRDVGARRTHESLLYARSSLVAAAAAAGIQASDTVFSDLNDEEGLAKECESARDLGFTGKGAINPRQLEVIHRVFSPTREDIDRATRIVAAAEEAERSGSGAIALDGKMIDKPVLERARRVLKYAAQLRKGCDRP